MAAPGFMFDLSIVQLIRWHKCISKKDIQILTFCSIVHIHDIVFKFHVKLSKYVWLQSADVLCEDFAVRILASDDFLAKGKACKYAHSHNTVCGGICQLGVGTSYRCVDTDVSWSKCDLHVALVSAFPCVFLVCLHSCGTNRSRKATNRIGEVWKQGYVAADSLHLLQLVHLWFAVSIQLVCVICFIPQSLYVWFTIYLCDLLYTSELVCVIHYIPV